jgi:hypothetical protein
MLQALQNLEGSMDMDGLVVRAFGRIYFNSIPLRPARKGKNKSEKGIRGYCSGGDPDRGGDKIL